MKLARILLAVALVSGMGALAFVAQRSEPAGAKMVTAAQKFLGALDAEQKKKATFEFDSKERTTWHFVPLQDKERRSTRKGLALQDMSAEQKTLALDLLAAGTSTVGNEQARTIMSLEAILREQEKGKKLVRDPEWYFFTVFGTPSKTGKWGFRIEGHHLSLNMTLDGVDVVSATPAFYGANPATIVGGAKKGHRTLGTAEDLAWELFKALDDDQKKIAYQEKPFPEIKPTVSPKVGPPVGISADKMTPDQKAILLKLLQAYTARNTAAVAAAEMKQVRDAGIDKIHFAFQGGLEKGKKHTYRVQGPTILIEFLNEQADSAKNTANHIHSAHRRMKGDFGLK